VDFVDRVHGTGFPEIRPRKPHSALPVDDVDFLTGTDIRISFIHNKMKVNGVFQPL